MADRQLPNSGDAVSQLVQLVVRDVGIHDFRPTGKGDSDIRALAVMAHNAMLGHAELWTCINDLCKAVDADPALPAAFRATLCAGILRARACVQLASKA